MSGETELLHISLSTHLLAAPCRCLSRLHRIVAFLCDEPRSRMSGETESFQISLSTRTLCEGHTHPLLGSSGAVDKYLPEAILFGRQCRVASRTRAKAATVGESQGAASTYAPLPLYGSILAARSESPQVPRLSRDMCPRAFHPKQFTSERPYSRHMMTNHEAFVAASAMNDETVSTLTSADPPLYRTSSSRISP